jgi:hypothetical protein
VDEFVNRQIRQGAFDDLEAGFLKRRGQDGSWFVVEEKNPPSW